MGVTLDLIDLLNISEKGQTLSLPVYKENGLVLKFLENPTENYTWKVPPPFAASDCFNARVIDYHRLSASSANCKRIYEISLDVTDRNLKWTPGDTIGILPQNDTGEVMAILDHLGILENACYELTVTSGSKARIPAHIPTNGNVRYILQNCLDIRCCMKKLFLLALSKHTKEESEKRVLEYLCSKEGSADYNKYILTQRTSIIDIFRHFKTCKPSLDVILAHLPRLLPRPYSIRNSQLKVDNVIKICFSVSEISNKLTGVATSYMEKKLVCKNIENIEERIQNLSLNGKSELCDLSIYLRKNMNGFVLPEDVNVPLLLIGPGTGVAPFIGFLEERKALTNLDHKSADIWLFFGCRNPELDYLYKKQLEMYLADSTLTKLNTAFSRTGDKCKYVQDSLIENAEGIVKFIRSGACVYVCGDQSNMSAQVKDAIKQCFIQDGLSDEESAGFIVNLEKTKRYLVDAWN